MNTQEETVDDGAGQQLQIPDPAQYGRIEELRISAVNTRPFSDRHLRVRLQARRGYRHGLEKLVDAYRNAGGAPSVSPQAVQVHELCMLGAWYRGELEDSTRRPTGQPLSRLRALLKRLRPTV